MIWNNEVDEKKASDNQNISTSQHLPAQPHGRLHRQGTQGSIDTSRGAEIRESQLYKRILGQSLKQAGLGPEGSRQNSVSGEPSGANGSALPPQTPHLVPPKSSGGESSRSPVQIPGFSESQSNKLVREVAEMAATAATIAARDATGKRKASKSKAATLRAGMVHGDEDGVNVEIHVAEGGGHDAPNWSRLKSSVILCGATVLYAMIAEILVNTVDIVLTNVAIDEKFLGFTLFALVPNTTEFLVSVK